MKSADKSQYVNICRRAMSCSTGPLQVVPDIDDDNTGDNKTDDSGESSNELLSDIPPMDADRHSTPNFSDVVHGLADSNRQPKIKSPARRRRHLSSNPPIHRMSDDAQPLTPTELMAHRQLLIQHRT